MQLMFEKVFIVWLTLIPFVTFNSAFEGPKILVFWIGGFILFVVWIFSLSSLLEKLITKSDYYYFLWIIILTLSSLVGVHPQDSIIGGSYRHQGIIFFASLWVIGKTISRLDKK